MIGFVFSEGVILIMIQNRFRRGQGIPVSCFRVVFPFAALALLGLFLFWGCGAPRRPAFDPNYVPKERFQMVRESGAAGEGGAMVENLAARQEGRDAVLTYDLIGAAANATDEVLMEVSMDEGKTWKRPKGLWGDVGKGVAVGKSRSIQWATIEEYPQGFSAEVRFRVVTATDRERRPAGEKETIIFTGNGVTFKMVRIPAGEFLMGSPSNKPGRDNDETQHRVRISRDFWLGQTEVTQGLWKAVMGSNPSHFSDCGDDCPVEQVSWNDCQDFIRKLNGLVSGGNFRLPTEAEWEYACRAGTTSPYAGALDAMGWHDKNSWNQTHRVAQKAPNAWGLYDVHGNVWEWCEDWYGDYPSGSVTDPTGPSSGSYRVRNGYGPGNRYRHSGFRLALP